MIHVDESDPDDIPVESRVTQATSFGLSKSAGRRKEKLYQAHIDEKRKAWRLAGNRHGNFKPDISPPAELYHGKIKQTGDKHYWDDERNKKKHHSTCKVGD